MKQATWLFSRNVDLAAFLGSAILSFGALGIGAFTGDLDDATPTWAWVPAIVLCDVAHVWATLFRTYLDPMERRARRRLLAIVPAAGLGAAVALYALGPLTFWRGLAYLAILHFVRQQYGWVALYRARAGETGALGRAIDTAAIYAATVYPLVYWHTHLPRRFSWFVPGDVVALPTQLLPAAAVLYVAALSLYCVRSARSWFLRTPNPGKDLVVLTTALAWYIGIVHFDSDYAFTVTNVFMHGIPYFVIVWWHARAVRPRDAWRGSLGHRLTKNVAVYLGVLWTLAFCEELLWDRGVWHDRPFLFGDGWNLTAAELVLVPLLAVPQLTHYVLDAFLWRRRSNPSVARLAAA